MKQSSRNSLYAYALVSRVLWTIVTRN